jgi:hypothetical protein
MAGRQEAPLAEPLNMQRRGALGIVVLVVPVVSIIAVGIGYGILLWYGYAGRPAEGPNTRIDFEACPAAQAVIANRVERIGLPNPVFTATEKGFSLTVRMPADEKVAADIPATLVAPGKLEVARGEHDGLIASSEDIDDVSVSMGFMDAPRTWIKLKPAATARLKDAMSADMQGHISIWVDGEVVTRRKNAPPVADGQLDLAAEGQADVNVVTFAAAMGVVLSSGPLPCPVTLLGSTQLDK